jgi:hypothetical protein
MALRISPATSAAALSFASTTTAFSGRTTLLIEFLVALDAIKDLFEHVPVVFYAATTASIITLLGAWLQNRSESQRNMERLTHDAMQRDREREMALRREVYFRAAEAMAQAQEYLSGFASSEIAPQRQDAMIRGVGADLNKVHIVGSLPTVKAIVEANQFFVHAVADLSIKKLPLQQLVQEIEYEQRIIDSAAAQRDEALTTMKEMNRAGTDNRGLWEIQNRIFHDEQKDIDAALAKRERLQQTLAQRQLEFLRLCADAGLQFGKLVVKANLAIRRELELPLDAAEYLTLMQRSHDTLGREVEQFHQRIKHAVPTELTERATIAAKPEGLDGVAPAVARHHALRRLGALYHFARPEARARAAETRPRANA